MYAVGKHHLLYGKNGFVFSYINITYFGSKRPQHIKASSVLVTNCRQNLLTFHFITPTFNVEKHSHSTESSLRNAILKVYV